MNYPLQNAFQKTPKFELYIQFSPCLPNIVDCLQNSDARDFFVIEPGQSFIGCGLAAPADSSPQEYFSASP